DLLARVVEPARQLETSVVRVHHELNPVERGSVRLVVPNETTVCDLVPRVPVFVELEVEDKADCGSDQLPAVFDTMVALLKVVQLTVELLLGCRLHSREAARLERSQLWPVLLSKRTDNQVSFEGFEIQSTHGEGRHSTGRAWQVPVENQGFEHRS